MTTMFEAFMIDYSANITNYREMQKFNTEFLKGVSKSERKRLTEGITNSGSNNVARLYKRIKEYKPRERELTDLPLDQLKESVRSRMIAKGYKPDQINQTIKYNLLLCGFNDDLRTHRAWSHMIFLLITNQC